MGNDSDSSLRIENHRVWYSGHPECARRRFEGAVERKPPLDRSMLIRLLPKRDMAKIFIPWPPRSRSRRRCRISFGFSRRTPRVRRIWRRWGGPRASPAGSAGGRASPAVSRTAPPSSFGVADANGTHRCSAWLGPCCIEMLLQASAGQAIIIKALCKGTHVSVLDWSSSGALHNGKVATVINGGEK